jgi:hypothetical protein
MMSRREPIDQVLLKIAELLTRPDTSSVSDEEVRRALGWSPERADEVRQLMAQLVEEGDLVGPRNAVRGGLRDGAGRLLNVDVLDLTPQGRQRVALLMLPWWRRAWRWPGRPVAIAMWSFVVLVVAGVVVAVVVRWLGLA